MAMIEEIGAGISANLTSSVIIELVKYLKIATESEKNLQFLIADLTTLEEMLRDIGNEFEDQQKALPLLLRHSLESVKNSLQEVKDLIDRAKRQRQRCMGCCLPCNLNLPAQIKEWKTNRFNQLFQQLGSALARVAHTAQILEFAQPQAEVLLHPLADLVGSGIEAARIQFFTWVNEHPRARVIGVYGMGGIGKTSLLQLIYNQCKQKVSGDFDLVIWFTVAHNYNIESLQYSIAESLNLKFEQNSSIEMRKMKLYARLEEKKFLLILDDLRSKIDLDQVGVHFGHHNRSKVLISSRKRDVVEIMASREYCMMLRPLSTEEGWDLFRRRAFTNEAVPDKNLETISREVASECKGLPLAINTVAAALARKTTDEDWSRALDLMRNVDPAFPVSHGTIEAELYQPLIWSYDDLPNNLKMCFLYCAIFPEDAEIEVETLVEMWTAEGLVTRKGTTYFMDVGRQYVDTLVDRCLIEYVDIEKEEIKVHDVVRDMAIYIGQGEERWLFLAGQHLKNFPTEKETRDRQRISVANNEITHLPIDLKCPTLMSLVLAKNIQLKEIPESFLVSFRSLKVLDLSNTQIQALPSSAGQLGQLEFLNLKMCDSLVELPDSICNLSHLQFLNIEDCKMLNSFPDRIGELKNLKHLKICDRYGSFKVIPCQISHLTALNKLVCHFSSTAMSVEELTNLSNLIELNIRVKPKIKRGSMSTWSEMRKLTLWFHPDEDENQDDVAVEILPQNMQNMKRLQVLHLYNYVGVSLPNCISQFQNLRNLCLFSCSRLKELPALENGHEATSGGFPMLERLELSYLDSLESIVWNENTMLKLRSLEIFRCPGLKTMKLEQLPNLRHLNILECNELTEFYIGSGIFPMLETLTLTDLPKLGSIANLGSIAVSAHVWNEKERTMPKLRVVWITNCKKNC